MVNKYTDFEVVSFTRAKDTKGALMYQNGPLEVMGHSRASAMLAFNRLHMIS